MPDDPYRPRTGFHNEAYVRGIRGYMPEADRPLVGAELRVFIGGLPQGATMTTVTQDLQEFLGITVAAVHMFSRAASGQQCATVLPNSAKDMRAMVMALHGHLCGA